MLWCKENGRKLIKAKITKFTSRYMSHEEEEIADLELDNEDHLEFLEIAMGDRLITIHAIGKVEIENIEKEKQN